MADKALEPLRLALDKRAAGEKLSAAEQKLCEREARGLERPLKYLPKILRGEALTAQEREDSGAWFKGGSKNIGPLAAAAAGRWDLIAGYCQMATVAGLFESEAGSGSSFYFGIPIASVMVALRDARKAGDTEAVAAMERWLRAVWTWEALVSVRIPGDKGVASAIAGNRNKHGVEDSGHRGETLAHALDLPRPGKGVRASEAVLALCGTKKYAQPTSPEPWGLTADLRPLFVRVVDGDVEAAREAMGMMLGTQPGDRWELLRTDQGAQKVFFGQPNRNGPAIAAGKVYADGRQETLEPEDRNVKSNPEWRVLRNGNTIRASVRGKPEVIMPEICGSVLWRVTIEGSTIRLQED